MNNISGVTKRDIKDLLDNGFMLTREIQRYDIYERPFMDEEEYLTKVSCYGRLTEIEFLSRVYDLSSLPSDDGRFSTAEQDIWQHTINNDDWPDGWVFSDYRFNIMNGSDEDFLKFIVEVFNPVVRIESEPWKELLALVNKLLSYDGYELYESKHMSGRSVYSWRLISATSVEVPQPDNPNRFELKMIGEGSYANVYKYSDEFYGKQFVLKRAKKDLSSKEVQRFKNEFDQMKEFNSPYVVEVYKYQDTEYIMEYMDYTLRDYISKFNGVLTLSERKGMVYQILKGISYIHEKGLLHRDISHSNILVKVYDDIRVVKLSDFGLVKIPDSDLTSTGTEFKGVFNDPQLRVDGFSSYSMLHETYALTRLIYFVMTGRTNAVKIPDENLRNFVHKGLDSDTTKRYQNVEELSKAFYKV